MNWKEQFRKALETHPGQEAAFAKLFKAKVYDFKTRQHVPEMSDPDAAPELVADPEHAHGHENALRSVEARYGNDPEILSYYQQHKNDSDEPYFGGDIHNLQYRTMEQHKGKWNEPMPFPAKVTNLNGHLGKYVHQGGPDPLAWMERKYGVSKKLIEAHHGKPLTISTRSDLIAADEYLHALDPKNHKVRMHLFTDNEEAARNLEPGAPSVARRMEAVKRLKAAGIPVQIVHDKIINAPQEIAEHNRLNQPVGLTNPMELTPEQLTRTHLALFGPKTFTPRGGSNVG